MYSFRSPRVDFTLVLAVIILCLVPLQDAQLMFNSALPLDVLYCEGQQVPTMFTVTCQYSGSSGFTPNWRVTGLTTMMDQTIASTLSTGPFIPQGGSAESTLTVNSQEVRSGTCFQCAFATGSGLVTSRQGCVTAVGPPVAPSNVRMNASTITWSPSAPDLSHRISACLEGMSICPFQTSCFGCDSVSITGITESCSYNITVCSSSVVNGVPCTSETCRSITTKLNTNLPVSSPTPLISGAAGGVIAGVAAGCLLLSLAFSVATGVITFLCTRRHYNKESSTPSTNEKSVYYETVQSDSVQMQPSPAYESTERVK